MVYNIVMANKANQTEGDNMNQATQNLITDTEVLAERFDRIERMDAIGGNMTTDMADDFGYDGENFEGCDGDGGLIHDTMWNNEAEALGDDLEGAYAGLQLVHIGSVEGVLKAVDPEAYEACQAIEDFFWTMAN
jgi:hypothetical protein